MTESQESWVDLKQIFKELPDDLKEIIEECLNVLPSQRPTCELLLKKPCFLPFKAKESDNFGKICPPFEIFTIHELYHWWQLAGGDVLLELKRQGLIRSTPPILSLPR